MPSGRKSLKDEIAVLQRFNELAPKYFRVITEHLDSKNKADRQWAVERLDKAFAKMVPQKIKGDGDDGELVFKVISYSTLGNNTASQLSTPNIPTSSPASD